MTLPALTVDLECLMGEFAHLASLSDTPTPAVTRVLFSPPDIAARVWLQGLFDEAGLSVRQDAVGNLFARWHGTDPNLPAIGTGSHTDAIPHAGRYDGTVGVLGALEALRALQKSGFRPRRSLEILMFTSEEPTRFGVGCLGSRLLSGAWSPEQASTLRDSEGHSLEHLRQAASCTGKLVEVLLPPKYYAGFVELHIEQGPLLEAGGEDIGIVTAIAAPATLRVSWEGKGGHAGAVLMPARRDALTAAAELSLAVEAAAWATGSPDTVATTGVFDVHPGAVNSIPSRVTMEIDVRDTDLIRRDSVVQSIMQSAAEIARCRQVVCHAEVRNADPPAQTDPHIIQAIREACEAQCFSSRTLVSRAYHDSLFMARIAPTGMIFIPCRDGVSHRPDEYSSPEQIRRGVQTLALTLAHLAS